MQSIRNFLIFTFLLLGVFACESYPKDPNKSLQKAKEKKLRVGAMDSPPWVIVKNNEVIEGTEVEIAKEFAERLGTEVEWVIGPEEDLMELLRYNELHLVIGGITNTTPWKKHIGLSNVYTKEKIYVCNSEGFALPEEVDDKEVGVKKGSAIAAYVKKKKGIPVFLDSLKGYNGLVAVYEGDLVKTDCSGPGMELYTEKHVLAVPKGENHLLMKLEEYLNEVGY